MSRDLDTNGLLGWSTISGRPCKFQNELREFVSLDRLLSEQTGHDRFEKVAVIPELPLRRFVRLLAEACNLRWVAHSELTFASTSGELREAHSLRGDYRIIFIV